MCMMCEEEFMYQAYLDYLARKAAEAGATLNPEEQALLKASGFSCDPAPESAASPPGSEFSRMRPKTT